MSDYAIWFAPALLAIGLGLTIHRMFKTKNICTQIWTKKCETCGYVVRVAVLDDDLEKAVKEMRVLGENHGCVGGLS